MKKNIKSFVTFVFFISTPLMLSSCGSENQGFYMANFDSYISSDLLSGLEKDNFYHSFIDGKKVDINDFKYRTYATNEDLERNFLTNYDIAVPSTYLAASLANKGELSVIDWSKFGLHKLDSNGKQTSDLIKSAADALTLFTPSVRAELASFDLSKAFENDHISSTNQVAGLLNYCVPYFLQDLIFGYKASDALNFSGNSNDWSTIMETLNNSINNGSISKAAVIQDYATIYGIGRMIQTNNATANIGNPVEDDFENSLTTENNTYSQNDFVNTYEQMFKSLNKKNVYYLNSDSNNILNDFANEKGSQTAISYNGDLLFAFQGGDNYSLTSSDSINESFPVFKNWLLNYFDSSKQTFQLDVQQPEKSEIFLDVMVLNKDRIEKYNHQDEAYAVLKKIGLEGADQSLYTYDDKSNITGYNSDSIKAVMEVDDNEEYIYGPMINFDYIQYTSPLLTLNAYVLNSSSNIQDIKDQSTKAKTYYENNYKNLSSVTNMDISNTLWSKGNNGYFTDVYSAIEENENNSNGFLSPNAYQTYIDKLTQIYNLKESINPNFLGRNMSDLDKSNMYYAFSQVKYNKL